MRAQNVAADLAERSTAVKYPAVNVYCEKIVNNLTEKFRTFSGHVQMAIEVRHSQDRLDGLQDALELYTDAVMQVLDASRGDWGDGMFYARRIPGGVRSREARREELHTGGEGHIRDWSEQELVWHHIFPLTQTGSTRRWRARTAVWRAITASNRIPAVKLTVQQQLEVGEPEGQDGQPDVRGPAGGRAGGARISSCRPT